MRHFIVKTETNQNNYELGGCGLEDIIKEIKDKIGICTKITITEVDGFSGKYGFRINKGFEATEIINIPYKDIAEMFNTLSELYKNANDKTVIDDMIRIINNPMLFVKKIKE
jgi:hypothetical protein